MTKKNKSAIQRRLIPTYIFLIIVSFISVFPLYWMISAATNTSTDVSRGRILPGSHFMENFHNLTAQQPLWRALGYDPSTDPSTFKINEDLAKKCLQNGAQPTEQVAKLFKVAGIEK